MNRYFLSLIVVFAVLILTGVFSVWSHETTHQVIFEYYGIESTIHYGLLVSYTAPDVEQYYEYCDDICMLSQNMVDVIGYPLITLTFIIVMLWGISYMHRSFKNEYYN